MKSGEIREAATNVLGVRGGNPMPGFEGAFFLSEIAAQLAELNEKLDRVIGLSAGYKHPYIRTGGI